MDNPVFNVKGEGTASLLEALKLGFRLMEWSRAVGYRLDKKKGLVLYWSDKSEEGHQITKFITPLTPEELYPQIVAFLESDFSNQMELDSWDARTNDGDITDYEGWRVYTECWGRIDDDDYAFLAITPSFCWSSK